MTKISVLILMFLMAIVYPILGAETLNEDEMARVTASGQDDKHQQAAEESDPKAPDLNSSSAQRQLDLPDLSQQSVKQPNPYQTNNVFQPIIQSNTIIQGR